MKFSAPLRAPEGLTSYVRKPRIRPLQIGINVLEGLLGLLGVVVIILVIRYGSFAKAGGALDGAVAWTGVAIQGLVGRIH